MNILNLLRKIPVYLVNRFRILFLQLYLKPRKRKDLRLLGGVRYGGWVVPVSLLKEGATCYCAGVGEDISFDLILVNRFRCEVFSFDPTPRAIAYVQNNASNVSGLHFYEYGLWSKETKMKFFAPKNPQDVSHSILNLRNTTDYFVALCKRLSQVMKDLGHTHLDLLKLDIEGAEYEVIRSIIQDDLNIQILCVEFDQPMKMSRIIEAVRSLKQFGYTLVNINRWDYTFVKSMKKE